MENGLTDREFEQLWGVTTWSLEVYMSKPERLNIERFVAHHEAEEKQYRRSIKALAEDKEQREIAKANARITTIHIYTDVPVNKLHEMVEARARQPRYHVGGGILKWGISRIGSSLLELIVELEGLDPHDMMCAIANDGYHVSKKFEYRGSPWIGAPGAVSCACKRELQ